MSHAGVVREDLVEDGLVEGVVVAEVGVAAGKGGVVLDGEVVLVEVVEVEGHASRVRGREDTSIADGDCEVRADGEAGLQACDQVGNGHVFAIAVNNAMVGQRVEAGTR